MEWEALKENYVPLKAGRKPEALKEAADPADLARKKELDEKRREHWKDIQDYNGDDPIEPWLRFIKWTQENFTTGGSKAQLQKVLEQCTRQLAPMVKYQNDIRFLRIWVQYADCLPDPNDVFMFLKEKQIGLDFALFYEAYATYLELKGSCAFADAVYQAGINRLAKPLDRLKKKYEAYQKRMAQRIARKAQEGAYQRDATSDAAAAAHRSSLAPLVPTPGVPALLAMGRQQAQQQQLQGASGVRPAPLRPQPLGAAGLLGAGGGGGASGNQGRSALDVMEDDDVSQPQLQHPAGASIIAPMQFPSISNLKELKPFSTTRKENLERPAKWTDAAPVPQSRSTLAPVSGPKLDICVDEDFQEGEEEDELGVALPSAGSGLQQQQAPAAAAAAATAAAQPPANPLAQLLGLSAAAPPATAPLLGSSGLIGGAAAAAAAAGPGIPKLLQPLGGSSAPAAADPFSKLLLGPKLAGGAALPAATPLGALQQQQQQPMALQALLAPPLTTPAAAPALGPALVPPRTGGVAAAAPAAAQFVAQTPAAGILASAAAAATAGGGGGVNMSVAPNTQLRPGGRQASCSPSGGDAAASGQEEVSYEELRAQAWLEKQKAKESQLAAAAVAAPAHAANVASSTVVDLRASPPSPPAAAAAAAATTAQPVAASAAATAPSAFVAFQIQHGATASSLLSAFSSVADEPGAVAAEAAEAAVKSKPLALRQPLAAKPLPLADPQPQAESAPAATAPPLAAAGPSVLHHVHMQPPPAVRRAAAAPPVPAAGPAAAHSAFADPTVTISTRDAFNLLNDMFCGDMLAGDAAAPPAVAAPSAPFTAATGASSDLAAASAAAAAAEHHHHQQRPPSFAHLEPTVTISTRAAFDMVNCMFSSDVAAFSGATTAGAAAASLPGAATSNADTTRRLNREVTMSTREAFAMVNDFFCDELPHETAAGGGRQGAGLAGAVSSSSSLPLSGARLQGQRRPSIGGGRKSLAMSASDICRLANGGMTGRLPSAAGGGSSNGGGLLQQQSSALSFGIHEDTEFIPPLAPLQAVPSVGGNVGGFSVYEDETEVIPPMVPQQQQQQQQQAAALNAKARKARRSSMAGFAVYEDTDYLN